MKKELQIIILILSCNFLFAQTENDTSIVLPVVEISNLKATQSPGMVVNKVDSNILALNEFSSISELLSQYSSVHIRNYGNGMLATINARGLGANHTSILWNSVPLNSPNLGLTDLSLLPVFIFDEVAVITGGTGTLYGNNSFGTAIELQNNSNNTNGIKLTGMTESYGSVASNVKVSCNYKKLNSVTTFFKFQSKNNFEYINTALVNKPIQRQINGAIQQTGFLHVLNYNFNNKHSLKGGIWYQYSEREIPPLMFMSYNEEIQRDSSLRAFGELKIIFDKALFINNLAYSHEYIFYNNFLNGIKGASDVKTYRDEITVKYYPVKKLTVNVSFFGEIAIADIPEYKNEITFNKTGINSNIRYSLTEKWIIGSGIKKEFTNLTKAPVALSASIDGKLLKNILEISGSVSKVYSLPTLNDLFWKPGGNENLKPENGFNAQLNFSYNYFKAGQLSLTGFYSFVNDWIQWIPNPSGIYSPINVRQVESSGIEASLKQNFTFQNWKIYLSGNYSFTNSINKSFEGNHELINKQIIFAPVHLSNVFASVFYKKSGLYTTAEFTGERFITADNSVSLDPYLLVSSGLIFDYGYDRFQFIIKPEIKNIFNEHYQAIPWRAMPGRSYFLTITMNLNLK